MISLTYARTLPLNIRNATSSALCRRGPPASSLASPLLLPLPPVAVAHLLVGFNTSKTLMGTADLCVGNGDCDSVHRLDNSNHDGKVQEFGVAAVWFSATKEDVLVSPARTRSFAPAYSRPPTHACVFFSSFTQIS